MIGLYPAYLPSIHFFKAICLHKDYFWITTDNFQKQTFRNRGQIYGANGTLDLIIPVKHSKLEIKQKDCDIKISFDHNWKLKHWKSIEAAYRSSAFFEFYETEFSHCFLKEEPLLLNFNLKLIELLLNWLQLPKPKKIEESQKISFYRLEATKICNPKCNSFTKVSPYFQVFEDKYGFKSNLSILDLLFNLGPESTSYLENL